MSRWISFEGCVVSPLWLLGFIPTCSFAGSLLEKSRGPAPFPSLCLVDSGETLLESLLERRDSTSSTLSSAYTLSRRSSGISPCCSSRRSSQASQFGANRPNNLSSADSYDPISADISRRSSLVSQFGESSGGSERYGGLPGPLSLTPAQHYHLRAKYAAATGGAPPTPLPHMDQTCLRSRKLSYDYSQEFGARSLMPHEVPSYIPRRASDPGKRLASLNQPQVQRYNSLGTLSRTTQPLPPPPADHRLLPQHRHTYPNGGALRYNLQPRSISENLTMEVAGDVPKENLARFQINTEAADGISTNQHGLPRLQARPAVMNANMSLTSSNMGPAQQRRVCPLSARDEQANVLVRPNQDSLGSDWHYPTPQGMGNTAALPQNHDFGPFPNGLGSNQQTIQNLVNALHHKFWQTSQHSLDNGTGPYDQNGNCTTESPLRSTCKQEPVDMDTQPTSYPDARFQAVQVKIEDIDESAMMSGHPTSRNPLRPRPPAAPKSQNHVRVTHHIRHFSTSDRDVATSLPGCGASGGGPKDNVLYYGQIHIFEPSANLDRDLPPVVSTSFEKHGTPPSVDDLQVEPAQIDFDTLLDDRSSLVSGPLSPALLQGLSQSSSRLTTPRTSVTLPPVPTGNMAIGDMSSLLTTLAEESKILDLMT